MLYRPPPLEVSAELTEAIRSGDYYREARNMYDINVHDMMSERYFYIAITAISGLSLLITFFAAQALYPLTTSVPFIYSPHDMIEDVPRMQSLLDHKGEDPGEAVLRFLVRNYVISREEYDINNISRSLNSVKSQSSGDVVKDYEALIDPRYPQSPVALYQRHSQRKVSVIGTRRLSGDDSQEMEVLFEASVISKTDVKKSRWKANITFSYNGIELDENDKPKPISFLVTRYLTKRLQESE